MFKGFSLLLQLEITRQKAINRISILFATLSQIIATKNESSLFDVNIHSENIFQRILTIVYEWEDLINLNSLDKNYPGLDLGDFNKKIGIQVTSRKDSVKVKDTLNKIIDYKLYQDFDTIYVYVITQKQSSYQETGWAEIIDNKFTFDKSNIIDASDILSKLMEKEISQILEIESLLEEEIYQIPCINPSSLASIVNQKIENEILNRKYIPSIFVETKAIKQQFRDFSLPELFLLKKIKKLSHMDFNSLNLFLKRLGLKSIEKFDYESILEQNYIDISQINIIVDSVIQDLNKKSKEIQQYKYEEKKGSNQELHYSELISEDKKYMFDDVKSRISYNTMYYRFERVIDDFEIFSKKILLIKSKAGTGKTNLICDFTKNVLLKRKYPCIYLSGKDFDFFDQEIIFNAINHTYCQDKFETCSAMLKYFNNLGERTNQHFVIIIDAINEPTNLLEFSNKLSVFLEDLLLHNNIKVILTCREEYFEHRFKFFNENKSIQDQLETLEMILKDRTEKEKKKLVEGHLEFFKLKLPNLHEDSYKQLEENPLFLRIFCECFGDPEAENYFVKPETINIYRDVVFSRYISRIKNSKIFEKENLITTQRLRAKVDNFLFWIIECMIETKEFSFIPVTEIPEDFDEVTDILVREGVLLNKGLQNSDKLGNKEDVINITYDELRDYLICRNFIQRLSQNQKYENENTLSLLMELTSETYPISEGVKRYLFHAMKGSRQTELITFVENLSDFDEIFINEIFYLEEEKISSKDISKIQDLFYSNEEDYYKIFVNLFHRTSLQIYFNLNITHLFDILISIGEENYIDFHSKKLATKKYNSQQEDYNSYTHLKVTLLTKICLVILRDIQSSSFRKTQDCDNIVQLLIMLLPLNIGQYRDEPTASGVLKNFAAFDLDKSIALINSHQYKNFSPFHRELNKLRRLFEGSSKENLLFNYSYDHLLDLPKQDMIISEGNHHIFTNFTFFATSLKVTKDLFFFNK